MFSAGKMDCARNGASTLPRYFRAWNNSLTIASNCSRKRETGDCWRSSLRSSVSKSRDAIIDGHAFVFSVRVRQVNASPFIRPISPRSSVRLPMVREGLANQWCACTTPFGRRSFGFLHGDAQPSVGTRVPPFGRPRTRSKNLRGRENESIRAGLTSIVLSCAIGRFKTVDREFRWIAGQRSGRPASHCMPSPMLYTEPYGSV